MSYIARKLRLSAKEWSFWLRDNNAQYLMLCHFIITNLIFIVPTSAWKRNFAFPFGSTQGNYVIGISVWTMGCRL